MGVLPRAALTELAGFAEVLEPEPAEGFGVLHPRRWLRVRSHSGLLQQRHTVGSGGSSVRSASLSWW